jgi:hypothetical protein
VLGSSAKGRKLVSGKCAFSFRANLWKLWELLITPTKSDDQPALRVDDLG